MRARDHRDLPPARVLSLEPVEREAHGGCTQRARRGVARDLDPMPRHGLRRARSERRLSAAVSQALRTASLAGPALTAIGRGSNPEHPKTSSTQGLTITSRSIRASSST